MYDPLPMSYTELLPILIQNYGISVVPTRPRRPPYPKMYDVNVKWEYHRGVGGAFFEELHDFQRQGSIVDQRRSSQIRKTCQRSPEALRQRIN